jgi:hypothetical protein
MHPPHLTAGRRFHQLNLRVLRFHAGTDREEPVMLARDLLAANLASDALDVIDAAIDRDPEDADLVLTLGITLLVSDELEWAKRVLTKAVLADPEWAEPWRWLGDALLRGADFERAGRVLARARALGNEDPAVGTLLALARRTEALLARVERFLANEGFEEPSLFARELIAAERLGEAKMVLDAALAADEEDPDLLVARAELEQASGDLEAARRSLVRATRADPEWEEAWHSLEALLRKAGDDRAANAVAEAAQIERDQRKARVRAEAAVRAAAKKKTDEEALVRARAEAEARAKEKVARELERARSEARERAESEARAKAEAEARARAEAEACERAEAEARERAEAEARERAESEARAKAEAEARERAEAEARGKAEARARAEATRQARAEAKARLDALAAADEAARREALENAEPIFDLICAALRPAPEVRTLRPAPDACELDAMVDSLLDVLDPPGMKTRYEDCSKSAPDERTDPAGEAELRSRSRGGEDTLPGLADPPAEAGRGMLAAARRTSPFRVRARSDAGAPYRPPSPTDLHPLVDTANGIPSPN